MCVCHAHPLLVGRQGRHTATAGAATHSAEHSVIKCVGASFTVAFALIYHCSHSPAVMAHFAILDFVCHRPKNPLDHMCLQASSDGQRRSTVRCQRMSDNDPGSRLHLGMKNDAMDVASGTIDGPMTTLSDEGGSAFWPPLMGIESGEVSQTCAGGPRISLTVMRVCTRFLVIEGARTCPDHRWPRLPMPLPLAGPGEQPEDGEESRSSLAHFAAKRVCVTRIRFY